MRDDRIPTDGELVNINRKNLWRLVTVGDLEAAELQIYYPILEDGTADTSRSVRFCSLLDIDFRGAHVKVRFEIPGTTLQEALDNFHSAGSKFGYEFLDKLEKERLHAIQTSGSTIGADNMKGVVVDHGLQVG